MASSDEKSPVVGVSSAPERKVRSKRQGRSMATIEDDDERLLNQIGYTQVSLPDRALQLDLSDQLTGSESSLHQMVDVVLRHLSSWSFGICSSHVWQPIESWRTSCFCMGMVYWIFDGIMHLRFGYVRFRSNFNFKF
jgi:hypothetical protein